MRMLVKRSVRAALVLALAATAEAATTRSAEAAPTAGERARAKDAYERGLDAHQRGEMRRAADEFARADALAPSAVALQAALDAAIQSDHVALGAELLERAKREPPTPGLASSITAATIKFNGRAGRLRVVCPRPRSCSAKIDEDTMPVDRVVWASVGQRTVTVQVEGGAAQTKLVDLGADQTVDVVASSGKAPPITRPATADATPAGEGHGSYDRRSSEGLPPVVFYAGVGLTVALAGMTTFFALQTSSTHGSFEDAGCNVAASLTCQGLKDDGEGSQTATNAALVLTAAAAIATTVVGVVFTNWRSSSHVALRPSRGGLALTF